MILYHNDKEAMRTLDEVPIGECFRDLSHHGLYKRLEDVEETDPYRYGEPLGRAICLSSGKIHKFYLDDLVVKVDRGPDKT